MEKDQIKEISKERLDRWLNLLVKVSATPLVLIAVRHNGQGQRKRVHLITCENFPNDDLLTLIEDVYLDLLRGRAGSK